MTGEVVIWEVATGKQVRRFEFRGEIESLAFGPSGTSLAVAGQNQEKVDEPGEIVIWQIDSGKLLLRKNIRRVTGLVFSPEGHRIIVDESRELSVFNCLTGKRLHRLPLKQDRGRGLTEVSADGKRLAVGEFREIRLFDLATGKLLSVIDCGKSGCLMFRMAVDGQTLTSIHANGDVCRWAVESGKVVAVRGGLEFLPRTFQPQLISADGNVVVGYATDQSISRTIKVWDAHSGKGLLTIPPQNKHQPLYDGVELALSRNSWWMATATSDGKGVLELWDLRKLLKKP